MIFIENANELRLVALESEQLKEINGRIGGPTGNNSGWKVEADLYVLYLWRRLLFMLI